MNALLSIKPEFAEKILSREKKYEFRRTTFQDPSRVKKVIIYATKPIQKIMGVFSLSQVIEGTPDELWQRFGNVSGISNRNRFMDYFSGVNRGYALEIADTLRFDEPVDPKQHVSDFRPPVSFKYINGEFEFIDIA